MNWKQHRFHPVIELPQDYEVYDFTVGYDPKRELKSDYGIGKFNEKRPNMYKGEQYEADNRNIHMGLDIAAPVGTKVYAVADGEIFCVANNNKPYDYGHTIICRHEIPLVFLDKKSECQDLEQKKQDKSQGLTKTIYILLGHLSAKSIANKTTGEKFKQGDVLGWVGNKNENGGWNPHIHFQVSLIEPEVCDMPGAVGEHQLAEALKIYIDPRKILGRLYEN